MWTFDLDNDILQLHKKDQNRRIPLRNLGQGPISIADLEPYDPPPLIRYNLDQQFPQPTWDPECNAKKRHGAYLSRILEDFSYQWRHVLRCRYNDSTFRRFTRAILLIPRLDFRVTEVACVRQDRLGLTVGVE